jgi:hypothetical protein
MDELMTIVNNIESLLEQLKQATAGDATKADPEIENIPDSPKGVDSDDELVKSISRILKGMEEGEDDEDDKEEVVKSAEGATASDDAEERIEDQPKTNIDNINEVAKAFIKMARAKGAYKSKDVAGSKLYKAVESLSSSVAIQNEALSNLIEGLGLAHKVQKSVSAPQPTNRPMSNIADLQKSLEYIKSTMGTAESHKPMGQNDPHALMKSLADDEGLALRSIFSGRKF